MKLNIKGMFKGLKCDNPNCDYADKNIKFEDYQYYVDHKCPQCGMRLMTQECVDACQDIISSFEGINGFIPTVKRLSELSYEMQKLPYLGRTEEELDIINGNASGPNIKLNF